MQLDLNSGLALFGALATGTNLLNAYMTNRVRMEITALKLEASELRVKEREWLEEKFMPRVEIEARFKLVESKLGIKMS